MVRTGREIVTELSEQVGWVEVVGHDHTIEALDALQTNWANGEQKALLEMAPGSGKTLIAAAFMRERLMNDPHSKALFAVDSVALAHQARKTFDDILGGEFETGLYLGERHDDYFDTSVIFATLQTLANRKTDFPFKAFQYGVIDEGHHAPATTYRSAIEYFDFQHLVGMTATVDRLDERDMRFIFNEPIYQLSLGDAIRRRILSPLRYYVVTDEIVRGGEILDDDGRQYNPIDFNRIVFAQKRDEEIIEELDAYADQIPNRTDPKRLVFCKSIEHARRLANIAGINARSLTSRITPVEQDRTLASFRDRDGDVRQMYVVGMVNEGLDVSDLDQVGITSGTNSKARLVQRIGRAARKAKGKKYGQIVDFADSANQVLMADRIWRGQIANLDPDHLLSDPEDDPRDTYEIGMSGIHFEGSAKSLLPLIDRLDREAYRLQHGIPDGAILLPTLARELGTTATVLKLFAGSEGLSVGSIPRYATKDAEFLSGEHAAHARDQFRQWLEDD